MVQRASSKRSIETTQPSSPPSAAESVAPSVAEAPTPQEAAAVALPALEPTPPQASYTARLLQVHRNKKGRGIQLDTATHQTLTHIAHRMGNITIADLLQNIVRLHFEQFGSQIQDMLKEKEVQQRKQKLLFQS